MQIHSLADTHDTPNRIEACMGPMLLPGKACRHAASCAERRLSALLLDMRNFAAVPQSACVAAQLARQGRT